MKDRICAPLVVAVLVGTACVANAREHKLQRPDGGITDCWPDITISDTFAKDRSGQNTGEGGEISAYEFFVPAWKHYIGLILAATAGSDPRHSTDHGLTASDSVPHGGYSGDEGDDAAIGGPESGATEGYEP